MVRQLVIPTGGQGLHEITAEVERVVRESGIGEGLCTVMVQHTSASLTIQENADPSARPGHPAFEVRPRTVVFLKEGRRGIQAAIEEGRSRAGVRVAESGTGRASRWMARSFL